MLSKLGGLAVAMALACGFLMVPAIAPAHAQGPVDVECEGTYTNEFRPALTNQPQNVTISTQYSYATCVTGLPGTSSVTSVLLESCLNALHALTPFTETITWSDRSTSTVFWSSVQDTGGSATFTGTVTAGRYTGDNAVKALEALDISGTNPELCPIGEGTVSAASGSVTLTLTSL
ncbi:hypothetical protein ACFU6K_03410 [Kitasatospora sp. NPDC057512]|uniref:hypothetical protein n=1 Tax=Kitasatospora sp. NPDC057512 TaxID=3346154 RepID=UPI00368CF23D